MVKKRKREYQLDVTTAEQNSNRERISPPKENNQNTDKILGIPDFKRLVISQ